MFFETFDEKSLHKEHVPFESMLRNLFDNKNVFVLLKLSDFSSNVDTKCPPLNRIVESSAYCNQILVV